VKFLTFQLHQTVYVNAGHYKVATVTRRWKFFPFTMNSRPRRMHKCQGTKGSV